MILDATERANLDRLVRSAGVLRDYIRYDRIAVPTEIADVASDILQQLLLWQQTATISDRR